MMWKNFNELSQGQNELGNKYLLNLDENLEYPYCNPENDQDYKKYIDRDLLNNNIQEGNDKMNYYFLLNNMDDSNNNEYQNDNLKYDLYKPILNFQNYKTEENLNKLYSDSNNNENKEQNKKNLFKIQSFSSTSKGDSNQNIIKTKESLSEENNDYINNYQNIPLKERMKIKKEKAKKLLENKTQRKNIQEESKENNIEKNSISNNSQENISGYISNNNTSMINNSTNNILNPDLISKMSKKEIKMLRNRLSAQRSRDRKKQELIDLKTITKNLLEENEKLRNEIKERDNKINELLNLLCSKCKEKIKNNNLEIKVENNFESINNIIDEETQLTPTSIMHGKKKLALLMTGLFTIFCIFGTFMGSNQNIIRQLKEKTSIDNKNNDLNNEKRVNIPFIIEKDYTIRHKKEIEMYEKKKRFNLKNKNLMVPASLFQNNSEQIISNINNSLNNNLQNTNNNAGEKMNNINNNKTNDNYKEIIHDKNIFNNNIGNSTELNKKDGNIFENPNTIADN